MSRRCVEFWSSVELGGFARALLNNLTASGWEARQKFAVSDVSYRRGGTMRDRFRVRWQSYAKYPLDLYGRLRGERPPDVVVVCTNTFYAPAVAIRAAKRSGVPVIHWVFDLFPDVLVETGALAAGGWPNRILRRLTESTLGCADANVFLGEYLLENASHQYGAVPRAVVIPVGADGQPFRMVPPLARPIGEPLRVLYCGNLGRMHDTKTILGLLQQESPAGWRMEFRGHGAGFRTLAEAAAASGLSDRLILGDSLDDGEWARAMRGADVALVTMREGAEGLVMPSKTYSAMVAGQAILAICSAKSDLARTVRRHDAGWVVEPGDVNGLRRVLEEAVAHPAAVLQKRRNSYRAGHEDYDQGVLVSRWITLLSSLSPQRGAAGV